MVVVDELYLRQEGDIGHAARIASNDMPVNDPFQTFAEGVEAGRHGLAGKGWPAFGPGVWSNPLVGVKTTIDT